MVSNACRADVRSATNALFKLATQCLLLHRSLGVIDPTRAFIGEPQRQNCVSISAVRWGVNGVGTSGERAVFSNACDAKQSRYGPEISVAFFFTPGPRFP
jgi:hypothetical protein